MADRLGFLVNLVQTNPEEIILTWRTYGSLIINNLTKVYTSGSIFQVDETIFKTLDENNNEVPIESDLKGAIVYCISDYIVDNEKFLPIDWTSVNIDLLESSVQIHDGVNLPHFKVLLTNNDWEQLKNTPDDSTYIPYNNNSIKTSDIIINDEELEIILAEVGCPFIRIDELEYTRDVILKVCIKPALQEYYRFFPLVEDQFLGPHSGGQEFLYELPPYAYNAIVWYTIGPNGSGRGNAMSPFAYFTSEIMGGGVPSGGGGTFGRGLSYRKNVPGFVGSLGGGTDAMLQALQAQQGLLNFWRREKINRVKKDGKIYIHGFSSIGGALNAHWLKWSPDWSLVDFEDLPQVRQLCQSYVLRNIAMIRAQVKSDIPGNIDYSLFTTRGDALYDRVMKYWNSTSETFRWTPTRGGSG